MKQAHAIGCVLAIGFMFAGCSKSADLSELHSCRSAALEGFSSSSKVIVIEGPELDNEARFSITQQDIEALNSQGASVSLVMGYTSDENVEYVLSLPGNGLIGDTWECEDTDDTCFVQYGDTRSLKGSNSLLGIESKIKRVDLLGGASISTETLVGDWSLEPTSDFSSELTNICFAGLVLTADGSGPPNANNTSSNNTSSNSQNQSPGGDGEDEYFCRTFEFGPYFDVPASSLILGDLHEVFAPGVLVNVAMPQFENTAFLRFSPTNPGKYTLWLDSYADIRLVIDDFEDEYVDYFANQIEVESIKDGEAVCRSWSVTRGLTFDLEQRSYLLVVDTDSSNARFVIERSGDLGDEGE